MPSGGEAAPERSFPLRAPAEVDLGAHAFGRARGATARVVSATWGGGPRQLGLAGSRELGVLDPPETEAALAERIAAFRPELAGTPEARATARFLLLDPPLALAARAPYALLAAAAVELLPPWARAPLRLHHLPVIGPILVRGGGQVVTMGIRWVMSG